MVFSLAALEMRMDGQALHFQLMPLRSSIVIEGGATPSISVQK
jgi:hypothetical protein